MPVGSAFGRIFWRFLVIALLVVMWASSRSAGVGPGGEGFLCGRVMGVSDDFPDEGELSFQE